MEMLRYVLKLLATLVFVNLLTPCYAVSIDKIVAFGDSLSDNGNLYTLTKRAHAVLPFVPIIPMNPPYYEGRFTNGENWLDILSKNTGLPLLVHAYGGSWAEPLWDSGLLVPFDINDQVALYIVENAFDRHKDQHLFVLWAGGNDYLDGRADIDYATTNTVNNIKNQIERLIYHGAHQLLIISLPDISKTPEVVEKGPEIMMQAKALVEEHNKKLANMVAAERESYPDIKIVYVDAKQHFDDIESHPEKYNFKDVSHACYGGYYYLSKSLIDTREIAAAKKEADLDIMKNASLRIAYMTAKLAQQGNNNVCENPDEYLFWDHIHPTRIAHHIMATIAQLELSANDIQWQQAKS